MSEPDYKSTILLPQTDFPMRASLGEREPKTLARWQAERVYDRALEARAGAPPFVFHDGPPYANGQIHYGHILNKVLKDIVVKYQLLAGRDVRFVPGWDCHGLPIELGVERAKKYASRAELRTACRVEAEKWIGVQRTQFERLGVFGTWATPYLTMDKGYERAVVEALAAFVRAGLVYRGKKPVYWCGRDRTALAEAEVEYAPHTSPSIYVKFPIVGDDAAKLATKFALPPELASKPIHALIWTTTPWTLPANLALAVHPHHEYQLVSPTQATKIEDAQELWLVAKERENALMHALKLDVFHAWPPCVKGSELEGIVARHPFEDRGSPIFTGDHVTLEAGTGLVHTAPGHGADDYVIGTKHGLPPFAPLDDAARFTNEVREEWRGKHVFEVNPLVVALLAETGRLANRAGETVEHSYPHCWRCKTPVVFRATTQWFIALDQEMKTDGRTLRAAALSEIDTIASGSRLPEKSTGWIPAWGRDRIHGMIADRPDWCISRQRAWGVPIPSFHCKACSEVVMTEATLAHVAGVFAAEGADAWFTRDAKELAPPGLACTKCGGTDFDKDSNILDVWFESGASFWAVMQKGAYGNRSGLPERFVDLYLEGSDQHRGWFHSALLVGIALTGRAPYERVLTHGFVTDDQGKAYSKSELRRRREAGEKVEYVEPEDVIKKDGAEIFRLWAAYEDYRNDVRYSKEHLVQVSDAYRKVRNTLRFLLGNLHGYDGTPPGALDPLDAWAQARLRRYLTKVVAAYESFDFRTVYFETVNVCADEWSSFYLDVLKDRLYCDAATSPRRRSAQATIDAIARGTIAALAPILCFTADEAWRHLPGAAAETPFLAAALVTPPVGAEDDGWLAAADALFEVRRGLNLILEPRVTAKELSRKQANVQITLTEATATQLAPFLPQLDDLLGVAEVRCTTGVATRIEVGKTDAVACARCWRHRHDVGSRSLCARCAEVLS